LINITQKKVFYLDSLKKDDSKINDLKIIQVTNNVNKFAKSLNIKEKFTSYESIEYQKQIDDFNCGVFVCKYYECLIENRLDDLKAPTNLAEYRKHIEQVVKAKSKITICCACNSKKRKEFLMFNVEKPLDHLRCGHVFHKECFSNNTCPLCSN
jgi:hypothetical protein